MKIFFLFSVPVLMIGASAESMLSSTKVAPAMTAHHNQFRSRMLEVSQQCLEDTNALYNTPELATAFAAFEQDLAQINFDSVCTTSGGSSVDCTLDSKTFSSHQDMVDACELVGGVKYLYSDDLSCKISEGGESASLNFYFVDIPECIAKSCDVNEVSEEVETIAAEAAQDLESSLSLVFGDVQCSPASHLVVNGILSGAAATLLLFMM